MSRTFMYALAINILGGSAALAQPLNINPFPLEKAGTLSSQGPVIERTPAVEAFADESKEEILRLERENEALESKLRELEMRRKMDQEELSRKADEISLERKNRELAADLRRVSAENRRAETNARENAELEKHLASLAEQQAADRKAEALASIDQNEWANLEPAAAMQMQGDERFIQDEQIAMQRSFSDLGLGGFDHDEIAEVDLVPMPVTGNEGDGSMAGSRTALARNALQSGGGAKIAPREFDFGANRIKSTPKPYTRERGVDLEKYDLAVIPMPSANVHERVSYGDVAPLRSDFLSANAGESLEDVLRGWSQSQGVGFLWKTTQRFDVLKSVSNNVDYQASVEGLLSQYNGQGIRPVGRLQTDPVTGFTTLSILSE